MTRNSIFPQTPRWSSLRFVLVAAALLWTLSPLPLLAAPATPGAGQILKEIPAAPPPGKAVGPGLTITPHKPGVIPKTIPFRVEHIRITGNTLFSTQRLHGLIASGEGRSLTLAQAKALADRITGFYRRQGYPLDRAYIPAQTITDATLTIAVVEARYDRITLKNQSRVPDALLSATLSPLQQGKAVAEAPLNRSLLLINEIPGIVTASTLSPGATPDTSDLTVRASSLPRFTGSVGMDNYGDDYTGRARLNARLTFNNPFFWGDRLTVQALTAVPNLNYGRVGYLSVINGWGTTLGASIAALQYHLGNGLAYLGADGSAATVEARLHQPVVRTVSASVDTSLSWDYKRLRDDITQGNIQTDRHITTLNLTFSGDLRDRLGVSSARLTVTGGQLVFDTASAQQIDAQGAKTAGNYRKFDATISRLLRLTEVDSLFVNATGQLSTKNLDPAEEFYLGGPESVSGYNPSALGGDEGAEIGAELRHRLTIPLPGTWQGSVFVNHGFVIVNQNDGYTGTNNNEASLSSAGAGLSWQGPRGWTAALRFAAPFGYKPGLLNDQSQSAHFWMQIGLVL